VVLLELSLLSVPSGEAFFQQVGPAFEAYATGDHEGAVAIFMSAVSGLDWASCRVALDELLPGAVELAIKDADTFFGIELPALTEWSFGPAEAAAISQPVLSVLGTQTQPLWVDVAGFLRSSVPHVEDCTIDGVGHLLHIERPEPVARAMTEFLGCNSMTGFAG
jgi:pimeloyl-ACP methyl ester carboxylesterase